MDASLYNLHSNKKSPGKIAEAQDEAVNEKFRSCKSALRDP
jgi:hypothetical protein